MIEVRDVCKSYGDKTVLDHVSLTFRKGVTTAVMAPSGRGKTTLLRIIAGLEQPDSGVVDGTDGMKKSFVFQENRLLMHRSVLRNILAVAPDRENAVRLLRECGLGDELSTAASRLSGGMQRRLAIARALAFGGDLFFLDEPLRELDKETERMMTGLIKKELAGKTVLLITHDEAQADALGAEILRL